MGFLDQTPTLSLLIYKSDSFSIHCVERVYFFLFHKDDFFFPPQLDHNARVKFLLESGSPGIEGDTCPVLAYHFHQKNFWFALAKGDCREEHNYQTSGISLLASIPFHLILCCFITLCDKTWGAPPRSMITYNLKNIDLHLSSSESMFVIRERKKPKASGRRKKTHPRIGFYA